MQTKTKRKNEEKNLTVCMRHVGGHHVGGERVDDAGGEAVRKRHGVECRVQERPCGEPEGDVRQSKKRAHAGISQPLSGG